MPKYKCPKCGAIYDEAPRFCSNCGVEFFPPKPKEEPVNLVQQEEPAPAPVEPTPVEQQPAPAPVSQPAPQQEAVQPQVVSQAAPVQQAAANGQQPTPVVVVVQQQAPTQQPMQQQPMQQQPMQQAQQPVANNGQEEKKGVNPRTIVGFVFLLMTLALTAVAIMDIFAYGISDVMLRSLVGLGTSVGAFILSIVTLAVTGSLKKTYKLKAMAVLSKVFGIICLILSIPLTGFWILALICSFMDFDIFGYNLKTFIENLLLYGEFSF